VLSLGSIGIHGVAADVGWRAYETLTTVFDPAGPRGAAFGGAPSSASPTPSPTLRPHTGPIGTPEPLPTPEVRPDWAVDGRFTLLLIGADAGPGRWKLRTDTMILLTVDVATQRAALIGIPRNVINAPMPPPLDTTFPAGFPDLLNALWVYVDEHPGSFPGDPAVAPFAAVQAAIDTLAGTTVDAIAVAELNGFVQAVDALGGLDIDVPQPVYDAHYPAPDGTGNVELYIGPGVKHLDGWHALAYARSRHQDGDYWRMGRQQTVLVALQRQLRCQLISRAPDLLAIARDTLWTNLPLDELPDIIQLARRVDPDSVTRVTLTPPAYPEWLDSATVERIHALVAGLFDAPAPSPTPRPSGAALTPCG
jgi:LCP family protein required for cell wall assembly